MPPISTQFVVDKCKQCPFYESLPNTAVSVVAKLLRRPEVSGVGTCKFNGIGQVWPMGRIQIPDAESIPSTCPLQAAPCTIALGGRR
jgi:hypothetical protein